LSTYCPLPWQHLATHPHGGITLCCISDHTDGLNRARNYKDGYDEFLDLNKKDINEHMNSDYYKEVRLQMLNNKKPQACMRCYEEEDKGIKSKRQHETEVFKHYSPDYASKLTKEDGSIDMDLRFVELRLGNVCNVRCRTCNPASSSKWLDDYKDIVQKADFVNKGYLGLNFPEDFKWAEDDNFYDDLYESAPNLELLYINGGEPTLIKQHWTYLQKLVDSGRSKNITLWYNINCTMLPPIALELWPEFKEARICLSIDDLEDRNAFIRTGTDWNAVLRTIEKLKQNENKLVLRITQTVSAYNYATLPEFFEWANSIGIEVDMNFVYDPDYLSPAVIPAKARELIHTRFRKALGNDHKLGTLLSMYNNNDWHELKWEQFCRYNDLMDNNDNSNWRETFSELVSKVEESGHTTVY
jgi:pyruvate-formate lyase-activating enzyme